MTKNMNKKTRAERRRGKLKRDHNPSVGQKIKPLLSFGHPITRFCLLFLGLLAVFTLLLGFKVINHYLYDSASALVASQVAWILKSMALKVHASGVIISSESFSVRIVPDCNAIFEIFLFLSAVIAFPALIKEKLVGGILGTIFIYTLNLLRVTILFLVGVYNTKYFEEIHIYVTQGIFIVMVAIFWLAWIEKGVKKVPVY